VTRIFFNKLSIHLSRISCKYLFIKSRHFFKSIIKLGPLLVLYISKYLHDYSIRNPPLQNNFLSILHSFHRCAVIGNLGGVGEGPWGLGVLRVAKKSRVGQLFSCCSNLTYPRHHGPSPPPHVVQIMSMTADNKIICESYITTKTINFCLKISLL
jgi:hypothetical protein